MEMKSAEPSNTHQVRNNNQKSAEHHVRAGWYTLVIEIFKHKNWLVWLMVQLLHIHGFYTIFVQLNWWQPILINLKWKHIYKKRFHTRWLVLVLAHHWMAVRLVLNSSYIGVDIWLLLLLICVIHWNNVQFSQLTETHTPLGYHKSYYRPICTVAHNMNLELDLNMFTYNNWN